MITAPENTVHRNPAVWSLTASVAIVGSNSLVLGPIAPDIASDLQTDLGAVLYASAAFGGGTALSAFFLARYIDRFGIKAGLGSALLLLTLAFVGSAIAQSEWHLVIAQFIAGIAAGIALPACYSGAAVIAPPNQSSRVLGIVLTGWTISLVLGVTLSALIADSVHWRSVYVVFAVLAAITTMVNLLVDLPGKPPAQQSLSLWATFTIKGVPRLLLQVACYMTAFYGLYNLVGDHVVSTLGHPLSANALIALSYGTGFGLATFLDPAIDSITGNGSEGTAKPLKIQRSSITAIALIALGMLYIALALGSGNLPTLIVTCGIWGLLNHLGLNILIASLNASSTTHRGAVLGLYSGTTYLCMSVGTILFSSLYRWGDFWWLCVIASVLCLFASALSLPSRAVKQ